jgi:hypothetical protein
MSSTFVYQREIKYLWACGYWPVCLTNLTISEHVHQKYHQNKL